MRRVLLPPSLCPHATIAAVFLWYLTLQSLLGFPPGRPLPFGLAFNSMAEHILMGRFDVDPDAIGAEAFETGGRTVAYFGIFCALLRIPLVLIPGLAKIDITAWSCLIAQTLAAWCQIRAVALIKSPPTFLTTALILSVILGGPHTQFLRPSLFQEPINWAFAQSTAFIYLAITGLLTPRGFDRRTLTLMALCAALALLTRVSFGAGLYAALALLLAARGPNRDALPPIAILLAGAALAAIVNQDRWGSPFVFADFSRYAISQDVSPDRLGRLAAYGAFNLERIWLTLIYYFAPIWIWIRADGHVLFAEAQATLMDAMELPPGSFLLTDPLLLILATIGLTRVRDRQTAALLIGLAVSPALILCAISGAHRYRMEFYPFFFLAALIGLTGPYAVKPRLRALIAACALSGIVASHAMAVLAAHAPWGPGEFYLERQGLKGMWDPTTR